MTQIASAGYTAPTNDTGLGQDGTALNEAFFTTLEDAINTLVHSATNTGITPANIIDEVVTARGNLSDLDTRISAVVDDDGVPVVAASVLSQAQFQSSVGARTNLARNSTFFLWSRGLALAPDYWAVTNGTVGIAGTSQSDTTRKIGKYCAKVTWSSDTAELTNLVLDTTDFANLNHLGVDQVYVSFGAYVKTSIASHARLQFDDGDSQSNSDDGSGHANGYHTGGGGWEWLYGSHQLSTAATKLELNFQVESSGSAYISGVVICLSQFPPTEWFPEPVARGSVMIEIGGPQTTGDEKKVLHFARPTRIDRVEAYAGTDPTGASLDVDIEKFEPTTTWTSMLSGGSSALIDDGDGIGQLDMDNTAANYDHRCIGGLHAASGEGEATATENKLMRLNIDQVGSTVAGSDLFLRFDVVQCMHPFEEQVSAGFVGE